MIAYRIVKFPNMESSILKLPEHTFIAKDENSRTYKDYLLWVEQGNVPEERDFDAD